MVCFQVIPYRFPKDGYVQQLAVQYDISVSSVDEAIRELEKRLEREKSDAASFQRKAGAP